MTKIDDKNELKGKQFTSEYQPSPAAKKKGWERRREEQTILDEFKRFGEMSMRDLMELIADVKLHPEKHSVREVKIAQYMSKEKFVIDWLDRHIPRAPIETKNTVNLIGVDDILAKLKKEKDVL